MNMPVYWLPDSRRWAVIKNGEETMKSTKDSLLEDIKAEFAEVNAMMEALEVKEPEDEASEAYDKWIEECEQLAIESESLMTLIDYKRTQVL